MATRRILDGTPGAVPLIRTDGTSLTFQFEIAGVWRDTTIAAIIVRCDEAGNIWLSIRDNA